MDKAVGSAKKAYGALTGDEALKAEGRAEQRKAEAEARQGEKTRRAEEQTRRAEKKRDRQRLKDKGPVGGVADAARHQERQPAAADHRQQRDQRQVEASGDKEVQQVRQ